MVGVMAVHSAVCSVDARAGPSVGEMVVEMAAGSDGAWAEHWAVDWAVRLADWWGTAKEFSTAETSAARRAATTEPMGCLSVGTTVPKVCCWAAPRVGS